MIPHTMSRYCGCVECDPDNMEREGEEMFRNEYLGPPTNYIINDEPIAPETAAMHVETIDINENAPVPYEIPSETFDQSDPFDFVDNLLDALSEDQLLLLENRIFSAIVRKRENE
jgi:hypothetical protein